VVEELRQSFRPEQGLIVANTTIHAYATRITSGPPRETVDAPTRDVADICLVQSALFLPEQVAPLLQWGADARAMQSEALVMAANDLSSRSFDLLLAAGAESDRCLNRIVRALLEANPHHDDGRVRRALTACLDRGADPFRLNAHGQTTTWGTDDYDTTAIDVARRHRMIVGSLLRIPVLLLPERLFSYDKADDAEPGLMTTIGRDAAIRNGITRSWRERPAVAAWAADLLVRHIDEPWAPTMLACVGTSP